MPGTIKVIMFANCWSTSHSVRKSGHSKRFHLNCQRGRPSANRRLPFHFINLLHTKQDRVRENPFRMSIVHPYIWTLPVWGRVGAIAMYGSTAEMVLPLQFPIFSFSLISDHQPEWSKEGDWSFRFLTTSVRCDPTAAQCDHSDTVMC